MKNNKGFTLIELIVGMAIMTLILAGTFGILSTSLQSFTHNYEQGSNMQDSHNVTNQITTEIRGALDITEPVLKAEGNKIIYKSADKFDHDNDGDKDELISCEIYFSENTIFITRGTKTSKLSENRVKELKFTRMGEIGKKNQIKVELSFSNKTKTSAPELASIVTISTLNDISSP